MTERPIIFSGEMVRAILDGRKTQTRRVVKPQPEPIGDNGGKLLRVVPSTLGPGWDAQYELDNPRWLCKCPYGQPGNRLWVRETFWISDCNNYITYGNGFGINDIGLADVLRISDKQVFHGGGCSDQSGHPRHRFMVCSYSNQNVLVRRGKHAFELGIGEYDPSIKIDPGTGNTQLWSKNILFKKRKPSIHMPRWASRITLEVTDVRVERVQDISRRDIVAEGINDEPARRIPLTLHQLRARFWGLWDKINAKRGFGWDANPWCWVVTFKRAAGA